MRNCIPPPLQCIIRAELTEKINKERLISYSPVHSSRVVRGTVFLHPCLVETELYQDGKQAVLFQGWTGKGEERRFDARGKAARNWVVVARSRFCSLCQTHTRTRYSGDTLNESALWGL